MQDCSEYRRVPEENSLYLGIWETRSAGVQVLEGLVQVTQQPAWALQGHGTPQVCHVSGAVQCLGTWDTLLPALKQQQWHFDARNLPLRWLHQPTGEHIISCCLRERYGSCFFSNKQYLGSTFKADLKTPYSTLVHLTKGDLVYKHKKMSRQCSRG